MDETTTAPARDAPTAPPTEEVAWRSRLRATREAVDGLRQDSARLSDAIAVTERAVASSLRELAAQDRDQGRTAVADRREARALDAERFAEKETTAARGLGGGAAPGRAT